MNDTVIKGTRNSRSIVGAQDIPDDPAEAIALLKSTGWPIDLGPLNPLGVLQIGTGYTKATMLTDQTATIYGFGSNSVPNDIFKKIGDILYNRVLGKYLKYITGSYTGNGGQQTIKTSIGLVLVVIFATDKSVCALKTPYGSVSLSKAAYNGEVGFSDLFVNGASFGVSINDGWHYDDKFASTNTSGTTYKYIAIGREIT